MRIDAEAKLVELPRPAGVILALTPSTNPIATVYFKVLLALMTRNAIVVSARIRWPGEVSVDAAKLMAQAAVTAGAPDGCIQVVEEPTIPLIEALMGDPGTDVIVATGGIAVVRAAYRSGQPGDRSRPRQRPGARRCTAPTSAARPSCLVDSKSFRQLDPVHQRVDA